MWPAFILGLKTIAFDFLVWPENRMVDIFHPLDRFAHFPQIGLCAPHFSENWPPMIVARLPTGLNY